ncbi:hypothetical protein DER44DRAFT_751957 [Fusarium oxysporum]|nr:hypothetical protein DER44DRAFT_751957 [Fusarium oxysporum]
MASQSSYEFPPEWGLVPPNPDPDLVLLGDAIEKELDRIEMPSLDVPISRIIGSTPLAFRPDVEIPELSEIDSETDEQPGIPPDAGASFAGWNRTVESDSPPVQRVTVIGGAVMVPLSTEPDTKPSDDKDDKDIKEEDSEEHDKDEPAREKIKLNTESFSLKGQPLGTLFPSINDFNLKNLPVENLELPYSEEKKNFLFKPGLRLEVDVLFTDSLAWAGDALKKLFGPTDPPKSIHLSAHLADTRDWSKRPKIENLVLQGFFPPLALKAWDLLNFRTLGIEITATKATKNKPSKEKPEGDKHEDGKPKGETDGDHDTGSGENETTKLSKFRATEQSPDDGGGENEEGEDDEEGSDDKAKEKKSWFFGFAFFGTVLVTKVPHANVPLDMNYRIARDFVAAEEEEKKKDDKEGDEDDKAAEDEGGDPKDDDKKSGEKDQKGKETDKKEDESKHKRSWNLLIKPDKWENIYGIEDVTMKDAELKASFEEGDFRSTVKLELSAELKLGDGTLKVKGQISRDDNFLEAEKIHAQISGQKLPEKETKKPDDERKEDEKKTAGVGSLTFASEGVTVQGDISDVRIPDTEIMIKKAGLEIFSGFKSKKNEEKPDEKSGNDKKDSKPTGESKPEVLGKDQDGEVAEKSLVKSSDKSSAKTPSEKKEKDHKTKKVERKQIRHSRRGRNQQGRHQEKSDEVKPKAITNEVSDGEVWINSLDVLKVAEEEKTDKDLKEEDRDGDKDKKEEDEDEEEEEKEPDNWDVLGTVDAYNYPVVKGLQLCATIPSFPQLEELNGKKKLEGLTLVLSITSNGKISATIDLPESFKLRYYYRHQVVYGARVEHPRNIDFGLQRLRSHFGGGSHCWKLQGKMSDDSKWANPFNLNKNMVFSQLGFGTGFTYATVLVTGPDEIVLRGQVDIGKFRAKLDMGLRLTSAEAVFQLEMNKLDAMEIIQLAGVLIDNQAMQQMKGAEDKLVFKDLKLYVSPGAEFLGRYYDRGIQVQGKMWCFGKKGEFDGRFDENGVVIKAGIDNFKVGGLKITSTREGVDRAMMDIEMTKDRQKLFIDDSIRYYSLEISVFLDLDIQEQYLKVDIKIKLTESLLLSLKADVVVKNHNSLEGAEMSFEAILETDILGVNLQGITDGIHIHALHKLADKAIDDARSDLTTKLAQKKAALKAMKKAYREAKEAKERNEKEIEKQRNLRDEARRRLGTKKTEMKKKYDDEIKKEKAKRDAMEREKKRLIDSRDASWGDALRSYREADRSWQWWGRLEKTRYDWKRNCEWNLCHCAWYDKAYWVAKLTEATLGLEEAHARKAIDAELRHAGKAIMDLPAFRNIEVAINEAARKIDQFGRALDGLVNRGLAAWIEEMLKDEREDLNRQIRLPEALLRKSEELEAAYKQAKKDLDKIEERLSPKQEAARKRIAEIEGEIKMLPAQHEYMNKKKDYENMEIQVNHLIATLDDIKRVMEEVSQISKDVLNTLKKGIPRVTKIIVRASNSTFADDKPLMFEIQAVWMDIHGTFRVEWAPNQGISVLYSQAAEKLATWGHEDEPPALPEPEPEPQDPDHKAKIHLIHRGANNDADWPYWSTFDGQTWSKDYKVWSFGLHISDGFCLASFQKKLFIFHLNPQNHKSQVFYESYASGAWTRGAATTIPNTVTSPGMCAVTFQGKLYLFHHGIPQEKLRYNVFNGRTWEGDTDIHIDDVTVGFTAVIFNDKLYLFYLPRYGFSSHRYAYVAFDGRRWEKAHTLARYATSGVTAAVYQNKLYLMHRGYGETDVKKLWYNAFDGKRWITLSKKTGAMLISDCDDIQGDICSVVYEAKMYVFYKKLSNSGVYRHVVDGNKWVAEQVEGVQTVKGVASVVH